ncbi:MAG TPA: efflux RND transporter periplasmic adaptor subunit [Usitatibacter sp.]|nr:efflux RND transporter periplasmic adaptor subunit [Usitatibacter sp.]
MKPAPKDYGAHNKTSVEAIYALIFAVCVLLALFLLVGCGSRNGENAESPPATVKGESVIFRDAANPALERLVVERVQAPYEHDILLPARLTWNEERTVRVFAPFAGRVTRLMARPGDRVEVGTPLAEMSSPDFGQAQADARKAQADLALASHALDRQKELNANGVASAKDLEQAQADAARARAEADRALGRLASYGHDVSGDNRFVLKSPTAGVVVERNINPGQELRPDQPGAPLFVITDPTHLWITIDAAETDIAGLRPGMPIVVLSSLFPEVTFPGELAQISDFIDPTSRTLKLRGTVPNPERQLKGEMYVTARIRVPKGTLPMVNMRAVYLSGTNNYVFVRNGPAIFTRHAVRVGRETDGRAPVISGLKEGDVVVVTGNLLLDQLLATAPASAEKTARR